MANKITIEGQKVDVKPCPKCNDKLIVKTKDGNEVFECSNCKFVVKKK